MGGVCAVSGAANRSGSRSQRGNARGCHRRSTDGEDPPMCAERKPLMVRWEWRKTWRERKHGFAGCAHESMLWITGNDVGLREVLALEQQRFTAIAGQGIRTTVADVQPRRMTPLPVLRPRGTSKLKLFCSKRHDFDARAVEQEVKLTGTGFSLTRRNDGDSFEYGKGRDDATLGRGECIRESCGLRFTEQNAEDC